MKQLVLAALAMALSACCPTPLIQPTVRVEPAADMLDCGPLPKLEGQTAADLARWALASVESYTTCQSRQRGLKEWIERGRD